MDAAGWLLFQLLTVLNKQINLLQYFLIFLHQPSKIQSSCPSDKFPSTLHSPVMKTDSNTSVIHFLQKEKRQYKLLSFSTRITVTTFFFQKAPRSSSSNSSLPRNLHSEFCGKKMLFVYVIYNSRFITYAGAYGLEFAPRSEELHQNLKAWEWDKYGSDI